MRRASSRQVHGTRSGRCRRALAERAARIFAAGSDTVAFEKVPDPTMPVHVHLLVESGIHIIECLNMEQLAAGARIRVRVSWPRR